MIVENSRIVTNVRNTKEIAQPARMLRILANLKKDGDYMLIKSTHSKKGTYVPDDSQHCEKCKGECEMCKNGKSC